MSAAVDPIVLLAELLREGDRRIAAHAYGRQHALLLATLVRAGALVPDGVVDTAICDACEVHHLVEVVSRGSNYGWHCPEAGFVAADSGALAALFIEMDRVVDLLSEALTAAFGTRRWRPKPLDGASAWILGVWSIGGAWTTVVLARGLELAAAMQRTADALRALPQNDGVLVLTIGEEAGTEVPRRFAAVPLTASLLLNAEGRLSVDSGVLVRAVALCTAERLVGHAGRPGVEAKVFAVLEGIASRGATLDQSEVNATVVGRAWADFYPDEPPPRPSTLRRHIGRWRSSG